MTMPSAASFSGRSVLKTSWGAALQNRDFQVYLQPKYRTESETIGGAEALVRWMGAEGIIYPDGFISLFEKNGFIIQLDLWVFEELCLRIRAWLDAGLPPVKVPVNCSRVQLKSPFLERYIEICQGAARRRNTLKSSSRKTWCSRTWANSARSSKPSMRPVSVALWTTSERLFLPQPDSEHPAACSIFRVCLSPAGTTPPCSTV